VLKLLWGLVTKPTELTSSLVNNLGRFKSGSSGAFPEASLPVAAIQKFTTVLSGNIIFWKLPFSSGFIKIDSK
jgi:hypothetical protein